MKALLLVDIQNDFLPGGALAVPDGNEVIAVANRLSKAFEQVVATQDWHPANHMSFVESHAGRQIGETITRHGLPQILWPTHCVQFSFGAELSPELDLSNIGQIFQKGTDPRLDSYSGFFDNARRRATGLESYLREKRIDAVCVMGLATDYCVKFTALDAVSLGFKTILILDGCRGVELKPGDIGRSLDEMNRQGIEMLQSTDLT